MTPTATGAAAMRPSPLRNGLSRPGWGLLPMLLLACAWLAETWLMLQHVDVAAMQASAPDEMLFIEVSARTTAWGFVAGYGPVFWLLVQSLFKHLPFDTAVIVGRVLFISFKYGGWLILFRMIQVRHPRVATLFLVLASLTPGYYFFGKVISPEYPMLFLGAMTLAALVRDQARFGRWYLAALLCASLAVSTKISAAPLLLLVASASLIHPVVARGDWRLALGNSVRAGLALLAFWGAMALLCDPSRSLTQIREALSIIPSASLGQGVWRAAWHRQDTSWDQILMGGLGTDFLAATSVCALAALSMLVNARRIPSVQWPAICCAWAAGLAMLLQAIVHQVAFAWYLFLPLQLCMVGAALMLIHAPARVVGLCAATLVALAVAHDGPRLAKHLAFAHENNRIVAEARRVMPAMTATLNGRFPCARTGHADILVPSDDARLIPMRESLRLRSTGAWQAPDVIVLNTRSMQAPSQSGLVELVEQQSFQGYRLAHRENALALYVSPDLHCGTAARPDARDLITPARAPAR